MAVVRAGSHQLASLPHDLLRTGRQLSFGLDELFPGLVEQCGVPRLNVFRQPSGRMMHLCGAMGGEYYDLALVFARVAPVRGVERW